MSWEGYVTYGGTEIINVAATADYVTTTGGMPAFRDVYARVPLQAYLGVATYSIPRYTAPWADDDDPNTWDFYGCWPLSVSGADDSTLANTTVESTEDGGYINATRHTTKAVVVSVALLGKNDRACDAGLRWLNHTLLKRTLWNSALDGAPGRANELTILTAAPTQDDLYAGKTLGTNDYTKRWTFFDTRCTSGPAVVSKSDLADCSGTVWIVSFTITAQNPFPFFDRKTIITTYPAQVPTVTTNPFGASTPTNGYYDTVDALITQSICAEAVYVPLNDPLCPAVDLPPTVPSVPLNCVSLPLTWRRRWLALPNTVTPGSAVTYPEITITPRTANSRNYRLRFYGYTTAGGPPFGADCGYTYEILIPYLPGAITIKTQLGEVIGPNGKRAEYLLTRSDGRPFDWPILDSDLNWLVAIDRDASYSDPYLSVDYFVTNANHGIL